MSLIDAIRRAFPADQPTQPIGEPVIQFVGQIDETAVLDVNSQSWTAVFTWATGELARLREANDATKLTADQTAAIRGQIRCLKKLMALSQPKRGRGKANLELVEDD